MSGAPNNSALAASRDKIIAALNGVLPLTVEAYPGRFTREDLAKIAVAAPSAHLGLPAIRDVHLAGGDVQVSCRFIIVLTAKDRVVDGRKVGRSEFALTLVGGLLSALSDICFDADIGQPEDIEADNLFSSSDFKQGIALWGVGFTAEITLSEADVDQTAINALFLGIAPETGPDHIEDYVQIGGGDD